MFNKKIKRTQCTHKRQKDFDWYITCEHVVDLMHGINEYEIKVIEPYVCVACKHREDVVLRTFTADNSCTKDSLIDELKGMYPQIRPKLEIEDEINDFIRVDREYLQIIESMCTPKIDVQNTSNGDS